MDAYLASIFTFAFSFTPFGFAACNGATLSIQQNTALFALLGTNFGGNGSTNFMLPDLRGRTPVNFGQGTGLTNRNFATPFGQENLTLTQAQLPAHSHTIQETQAGQTVTATAAATVNASDLQANANKPTSNYWAKDWNGSAVTPGYQNSRNVTMASDAVQVTITPTFRASNLAIGAAGSGTAVSLAPPSLALNFCICTSGLFPSRT